MGATGGSLRQRTFELLAPAGTEEAARAALANGADAVYLGLGEFNARRNAQNLGLGELERICRLAHLGGQRIYLTVNTVLAGEELPRALALIDQAWRAGIDAVIVQDLGLLKLLTETMPQVEVHASTQMNIQDARGVELLARLGVRRVTLARELSLEELSSLAALGVELEVFGHGALCVCASGQCLMSSLIGGRSANRGLCAQPCRLPYLLVDEEGRPLADPDEVGRYLLSPKDLSTIDTIPELIGTGVSSLKIEGRMKSPQYVATTTAVYRWVIDRALAGRPAAPSAGARDDLAEAFSRGFTTAYLTGRRDMGMMGPKRPNNRGIRVGRVSALGGGLVELSLDRAIRCGDVLEYWTSRGAVAERVSSLELHGQAADEAPAGSKPRLSVSRPVAPGDRVFRVSNARLEERAAKSYEGFAGVVRPVEVRVACRLGEPLAVTLADREGHLASAAGPQVEPARTKAVTEQDIREHVGRFGGTCFTPASWDIDLDEGVGVGFSLLHRLRREAAEKLEEELLAPYAERSQQPQPLLAVEREEAGAKRADRPADPSQALVSLLVSAENADAAREAAKGTPVRIEVPAVALAFEGEEAAAPLRRAFDEGAALMMPVNCHDGRDARVMELVGEGRTVVAESLSLLDGCVRAGASVEVGPHLPLWNAPAIELVKSLGASRVWLTPELSLAQIGALAGSSALPLGLTVSGAQELMVTEHCGLMAIGPCQERCSSCARRRRRTYLLDRKGYRFPLQSDAVGRSHLYNAVPLDLGPQLPDLLASGVGALRVDATLLGADEVGPALERMLEGLARAQAGRSPLSKLGGTTTGHLFRGVR